jgi:hypothetical protein
MNPSKFRPLSIALLALAIPAGIALAGNVTFPATFPFVAGSPIRAADVNAAFNAVKTAVDTNSTSLTALAATVDANTARITALEAANAARASYHAGQGSTDAGASVDDTWVDVPGVAIPLTFAAATNFRYQLFAKVYNYGAAVGAVANCSVRIVTDDAGTPLNGSAPATLGEWNSILSGGDLSPNNSQQVALGGLITAFPAGTYNFKAQIVRKAMAGNSGTCDIFRWNFSRAQLFIDVVP